MILFMAFFTAMIGYGLGIGLVTLMITIAKSRLPNYAATITFWKLGAGLRHGPADCRNLKLYRDTQSPQNRAFRHLPGIAMSHSMKTIFSLLKAETRTAIVSLGVSGSVRRMQLRAKICEAVSSNAGRFQRNDAGAIQGN